MKTHVVLSALGRDRVGVADDLAKALAERDIDIEQSRMTALSGHSALIVRLAGEQGDLEALRRDLAPLGTSLGFHLQLEPLHSARPRAADRQYLIESFSEGPAAISAVTHVLKTNDVNIEDLETDASAASFSYELAFHMKACITLPSSLPIADLKQRLREVELERGIDIIVKPLPSPAEGPLVPAGSS